MELTLDQALVKGVEAHKAGKLEEADRYYTAILKTQPKHPDANHNMGVLAVGVGKIQEAVPFFKTALETNSGIVQFWLSYIDVLIKLNRVDDAKTVLDEAKSKGVKGDDFEQIEKRLNGLEKETEVNVASSKSQEPPEDQLQNLINLYTKGQFQKALTLSSQLLKDFPNSINLYDIIGATNIGLGRLEEAIEAYNKALSLKPDYAEAYNNMGTTLKAQGKLEEAVEAYNKALSLKPDYAEAYYNMGIALQEKGMLEDAVEAYNKALSLKPDYAEAYNNMGIALQDQGKLEEAVQAYNKTLSLKTDFAEAYYNMGNASKVQGKLEEAVEAYNKALSLKPDYAEAYNNMGTTLKAQGKLEEAVEAYNKALSLKPDYVEAYNNMGVALKDQSKLEEAIEACNKALSIKPNFAEAYYNMGIALQEKGMLEEAVEAYNKALSLKPDYADAYNNMGIALRDQGRLEEAIEAYKKAFSLKTDFAEAYNNMGVALKDQGKLEKAIEAFKKAIKIIPNYAESYGNMGITLEKNEQLEKALEIYEKGICIMPENTLLKMNLERLKSRLVPSWHINMMNDKTRNDAYFDAIKLAVSKHDIVLDIGTGSGLLSMMAADSGAKKIITCESSKSIFNIAKKIIAANGYKKIIKVINKKSTDLIVGKDLPEKVDLVISEILSSEFVGEGVQSTILDANNRLMKSNGKMIPESGEIRIALIGRSPEVSERVFISRVGKFDLTKFNSISGNKVNVKLKEKPNILSDTEIAFKINLFGCKNIAEQEKIIIFTAKKSGLCYGLIQWLRINIYEEINYENMPGEISSHWVTPIYLFDKPVMLELGEKIKIKASLFSDDVWFCKAL